MASVKKKAEKAILRKVLFAISMFIIFILISVLSSCSQRDWEDITKNDILSIDTIRKNKYTLVFINKDPALLTRTKTGLIYTFFSTYPLEAAQYNQHAIEKVIVIVDPAFKGVAASAAGIIRISPEWLQTNPDDWDIITHETMHIVQNYPTGSCPRWVKEGIADYTRFTLGIHNKEAHWELPPFSKEDNYTDSYRVSARFFVWVEHRYMHGFVKILDRSIRDGTYSESFWRAKTGKQLEDLWKEYQIIHSVI